MNHIINLGFQVDLLAKPDEWLDAHRHKLENDISRLKAELSPIVQAQEIKKQLKSDVTTVIHNDEITVMLRPK